MVLPMTLFATGLYLAKRASWSASCRGWRPHCWCGPKAAGGSLLPTISSLRRSPRATPTTLLQALLWAGFLATSAGVVLHLPFWSHDGPAMFGPGTYVVASALLLGRFYWLPVRLTSTRATPPER